MILPSGVNEGQTLSWSPGDARRGALLILPGAAGPGQWSDGLGQVFAEEGYEVLILAAHAGQGAAEADLAAVRDALVALSGPVFLLGFAEGAVLAFRAARTIQGVTAAALFYGAATLPEGFQRPLCPVILHVARGASAEALSSLNPLVEDHPEIVVWFYEAGEGFASGGVRDHDCATLALLRTRQHFHRSAGLREAGA